MLMELRLHDPGDVAETSAKHFYTTFSHTSPPPSSVAVSCSDCLPLVSVLVNTIFRELLKNLYQRNRLVLMTFLAL
jgi:hypothetical protein